MRGPVIDVDEIVGDDRIVGVGFFEPCTDAALRYEPVEHRGSDDRRLDCEPSRLVRQTAAVLETYQAAR
jgi:hypothetical protein